MSDRLKTLRRIAAVQAQLKTLAEWRLAASERRVLAVEANVGALDRFVESGAASGGLADIALKQAQRLAADHQRLAGARDQSNADALEARCRSKQAETAADSLARTEREADERRTLERLIEASAAWRSEPDQSR